MLKKRIVACLVVNCGIVVQSIGFQKYLPIGSPKIAVEFLNTWGIDEIILVDMNAGPDGRDPDYNLIKDLSAKCHVPLTVGGGIRSIDQIRKLMECGVDKIAVNHAAIYNPDLISEAAAIYGNQCIVVSIDAKKDHSGYKVFDHTKNELLQLDVVEWSRKAEMLGAGEIFLTSVDRDGSYAGFEIDLLKQVPSHLKIPVIASGGAGNAKHFIDVFDQTFVSAASAANIFHFSEHAVITIKKEIERTVEIRLDTAANYKGSIVDDRNRINKKDDQYLEDLLYVRIEKEII